MTSLTYQDAGGVQLTTAFTYDADGNVLTTVRYAVVSGTAQLAAQTNDAYDGGLVTSIVTTDPSGNVIQSDLYTYDVAARLSSQTDNGVLTAYAYDATSQLTVDGGTGYTYDANGNRTLPGYVTGHRQRASVRRHLELHLRFRGQYGHEGEHRHRRDVDLRLRRQQPDGQRRGPAGQRDVDPGGHLRV